MTAWIPSNNTSNRNFQGYRYNSMVQSDSNGGWPQRFMDRSSSGHQLTNAFHVNDNQSMSGTSYSTRPEGHIYEEVGPPTQPPPYFTGNGDMDTRIPSIHQTMDHHLRGSPSSLCSMCSRRCTGHRGQPSPPNLPACGCMSHGMQQPFCNLHGSISPSPHPLHTPMSLNNGHSNPAQQCSPTCNLHAASPAAMGDHLHHGAPCTLHPHSTLAGVSNQRYTAAAGTIAADPSLHNNQLETNKKPKDRSLSPFGFLRKNNRDSKVSNNTDSSSSKSVLMCSRRWLVAIALTLALIVVLSVAVGLVVTFTVQEKGKEVTTGSNVQSPPVERLTAKIRGSVRVVGGTNSVYTPSLANPASSEFQTYSRLFASQTSEMLRNGLGRVVNHTQVLQLRNGSVIVDFLIHLKMEYTESKVVTYADDIQQRFHLENNSTKHPSFKDYFPLSPHSILIEPSFSSSSDMPIVPIRTVTSPPSTSPTSTPSTTTTPTTTTPKYYTMPPPSNHCEPITNQVCQQIHYNSSGTTFPNYVGHTNQEEAKVLITIFNALMASTSCYNYLNTFSCALLVPKCGANQARIPPCRRLCEAAFERCGDYLEPVMEAQGARANCSWFPDSTDPEVCVDEQGAVVPTATPTCPPGYFSCDNHRCHEMKNMCDSVEDCTDGVDERNCENFQCVPGQFQCNNGNCRPKVWKCDGNDDCGDGSDEAGCAPEGCKHGHFRCTNGFDAWNGRAEEENDFCIEARLTCDRTNDCTDGSDEDPTFCLGKMTPGH